MQTIKLKHDEYIPKNYTGVVEYNNGSKEWYKEELLHRENGPAKEYINGYKAWYKEGKYHRENGPAIEYSDGYKEWYINGKRHRIDGPAIENVENPNREKEWCVENKSYTQIYLAQLITTFLFLEKEKGKYDLYWLRFFTETGIEEFPIVPKMETEEEFKKLFEKLEKG